MTADIRTAAEAEAIERWPRQDPSIWHDADLNNFKNRSAFVDGAGWAAARVTPTREQIAAAIRGGVKIGWIGPTSQATLRDGGTVSLTPDEAEDGADAVLDLMRELVGVPL